MSTKLPTYPAHSAADILVELLSRFNAPGGFPEFSDPAVFNKLIYLVFWECGFNAIQKPVVISLSGVGTDDQNAFLAAIFFAICNNGRNAAETGIAPNQAHHSPNAVKAFLEHLRDVAKDPNGAAVRTLLIHGNKVCQLRMAVTMPSQHIESRPTETIRTGQI